MSDVPQIPDLVLGPSEFDIPTGPEVKHRAALAKKRVFAAAWLSNGHDGTAAAIAAGYSPNTATSQGHRLLGEVYVQQLIREQTGEAMEELKVTSQAVLKELATCAFSNMADYTRVDENGELVFDFSRVTREQMAALTDLQIDEIKDGRGQDARTGKRIKFKLAGKVPALRNLGEYFNLFNRSHGMTDEEGKQLMPPQINVNFIKAEPPSIE
jgi:phage terminase small subunit